MLVVNLIISYSLLCPFSQILLWYNHFFIFITGWLLATVCRVIWNSMELKTQLSQSGTRHISSFSSGVRVAWSLHFNRLLWWLDYKGLRWLTHVSSRKKKKYHVNFYYHRSRRRKTEKLEWKWKDEKKNPGSLQRNGEENEARAL